MWEICSYLQVPIKRRAAAFCTICKWATEGDLEQPKLYTRSKRDENTNFRFKVGAVQAAHFWIIRFHLCFLFWVRLCCICRWWEISRSLTLFFHTHCVPLKKHSRSRNICCSLWENTELKLRAQHKYTTLGFFGVFPFLLLHETAVSHSVCEVMKLYKSTHHSSCERVL